MTIQALGRLDSTDRFVDRHVGPRPESIQTMLQCLNLPSLEALIEATVPANIRMKGDLELPDARSEHEVLAELRALASKNQVWRSYIGLGYHDCVTPAVILRNVLENPGWYTQYTPYQAEIAQGRLEALLNFQTLVSDLTGLEISNASLLDEATAAAEAMALCHAARKEAGRAFFVADHCHPQTIEVIQVRAESLGIPVVIGDPEAFTFDPPVFGAIVQYPTTSGQVWDPSGFIARAHQAGALAVVSTDLLALTQLKSPGELGADVAIGSAQRLGVPMGYGGPHAAFIAIRDEFKRLMPGRLVGVSKDTEGRPAIRLALQTREQHIRRDKATSNICTAQVLLAIMSSMYAVYHGPEGLKRISGRVNLMARALAVAARKLGWKVEHEAFFDTLKLRATADRVDAARSAAEQARINLRYHDRATLGVSLDETTSASDLEDLIRILAGAASTVPSLASCLDEADQDFLCPATLRRTSAFLLHPVFNRYHSETEMLRYLHRLQAKDLSLAYSMIPLGSCTMKLNATSEMIPVTWPEFGKLHPYVPAEQARGYHSMLRRLEEMLAEITGFSAVSLQPNAGSQGEYTGLLVIRRYHEVRGQGHRNVCLIPQSAHGTNPASAAMAGMKVVVVRCDEKGNIDVADLRARAEEHAQNLAALMVTYPSTHGVFEAAITEICQIIHQHGGQVYMDGANMNAQVGICRPGDFGADVCHLNLHKTFCIPHGGGGPGMGPIGVAKHLAPYLPGHPLVRTGGEQGIRAVSAAPWGSASILPISYVYIAMMGAGGLKRATQVAILNANYVARRLEKHYPVLYRGQNGMVAHECIIDLRPLKASAGVEVEDVAKRLMDYGFHAPTVSFPVAGTMMIEPTESESLEEMDRFCEAMIEIRAEIAEIEQGKMDRQNNLLKNAPHTADQVIRTEWARPYPRERAAYPLAWVRQNKFWPSVSRIDGVYGDRNLVCSCPPIEAY